MQQLFSLLVLRRFMTLNRGLSNNIAKWVQAILHTGDNTAADAGRGMSYRRTARNAGPQTQEALDAAA
ncbi:hypothetical protein BG58_22290 [Caballeronia jiangsuensis]|nr:hypothetical protein BG58_22290 [Caballeronia jiangsuensis]